MNRKLLLFLLAVLTLHMAVPLQAAPNVPHAQTYYVSTSGKDSNNGLSPDAPFATIGHVNSLALQPGDSVLFKCGDVWRGDPLVIARSGTASAPITFGAYPAGCATPPVFSGAQPIVGWTAAGDHLYVANLSAGGNAGKFAYGVNQLFRDDARLPMGRWPNLDEGDAGYATIDAQPGAAQIRDNELPARNWNGAVAHIRGMRWYILNRKVTNTSGTTLTFSENHDCWGGCTGWGYFLNNHLGTLDREGEWYYDAATQQVYLYTATAPTDNQIEGAVILEDDGRSWGGILLGEDLYAGASHVVIENLDIRRWFRHGIATPTNLHPYENSYVTIRDCAIRDVDDTGINLATWVWEAADGADGWRGGNHMTVENNVIERANSRGIDTYAKNSTIQGNVIRDVGRIEYLGAAGMGCSTESYGGSCTEDGDGIRIKVDKSADSGNNNLVAYNRLERIAYNGIDVFGSMNVFERNVIHEACYAKGDCGGIRTFGRDSLGDTPVYLVAFWYNMIIETIGNTDGCHETYKPLFGFGFYIDNYSRDVTIGMNTVVSATAAGILYQRSTGTVSHNVLYNNGAGTTGSSQVALSGAQTSVNLDTNILFSLKETAYTLTGARENIATSDHNAYFHPYVVRHISVSGVKTLAEWQTYSGLDAESQETWYTQSVGETPRSRIFYNDTATTQILDLGYMRYFDHQQNPVVGSLILTPFTSRILIASG
ncbi:MAG: right-handed parallel beta-helix repeat-containing protein, partial [Anaerolineae bacterium]|nr:right-handed parallel beta-helix repeat-containing protein [Anaerolineae bacterium]